MRKFSLLVLCIVITTLAIAQQKGKASITILNEQKSPVENATVELLRSKDSVLVKAADPENFVAFRMMADHVLMPWQKSIRLHFKAFIF